ncbi:type II toxin-antitoxin system RelE/ParE family toxin [Streptomyces sp. NPDC059221]
MTRSAHDSAWSSVDVGRYRVLYEIAEARVTIIVIHVGRLG